MAATMAATILLAVTLPWSTLSSSSTTALNDAWRKLDVDKRTAKAKHVQYDSHPFNEVYATQTPQNKRQTQFSWQDVLPGGDVLEEEDDNIFFQDNRYPISSPTESPTTINPTSNPTQPQPTSPPTIINYNPAIYKPIRITFDDRQLQLKVSEDPYKYTFLVDYITQVAAPKAATFWSNHLSTIPVSGTIIVASTDCPVIWSDMNDSSEYHTFNDSDLVLYLIMDEGPCIDGEQGSISPIAFSDDCLTDQFDRPIAGTLLICSEHFITISSNYGEDEENKDLDEVLQHELGHVLGMSGNAIPYWRDASKGGKPYTNRPLVEQDVVCINGETKSIIMPSSNTLQEGVTNSGSRYFEVVTPTVRNVIANQFNCHENDNAVGARLDHNEYYNCIGSHLSTRYYGTETLVSRNMPWEQSISAVTLALFEDTGWYKANYSGSDGVLHPSSYGYGAGCEFLNQPCIVNGEIPNYGSDTFCNEETEVSSIKCDVTHKRGAKCDLVDYNAYDDDPLYPYSNVPDPPSGEYQHFTNSKAGSFLRFDGDYCPTYVAPSSFTYDEYGERSGPKYIECTQIDSKPNDVYTFETFGSADSTCFNTLGTTEVNRPLCLSIQCIESGEDVSVAVSVGYGDVICERDGQVLDLLGSDVQIECPRIEILCPKYVHF